MVFKKEKGRIFYFCPDSAIPSGGIKKIYQHVDLLNELGFSAFVVHNKPGFRCSWFDNTTPIAYLYKVEKSLLILGPGKQQKQLDALSSEDILVYPEVTPEKTIQQVMDLGFYTVIFNQNAYYTFLASSSIYKGENVLGAIVVSEDSKKYLEYTLPSLSTFRIHISIDFNIFSFQVAKKKQIAYMPRKCESDSHQIISILNERGLLKDWKVVPIDNMSEREVAHILKESAIFLSFSHAEGFGLPPVEAISCGCLVIGYHGGGGREYFQGDSIFPIVQGEIIEYVKTVEKVTLNYNQEATHYAEATALASILIQNIYSLKKEKEDLKNAWESILYRK